VTQSVVSVVIAVFNDARHLPSAIESVRAQTRTGIEIVVVDDGSSDDSAGVAERLDVDQLIRLPTNQGPSMARNVGIARASGDLITFLDADDRMVPHRVARQEEFLAEHWELTGVFADQEPEVELGAPLPSWYGAFGLRPGESGGMPISVMFRSRALLEVGGFDPDLRMGEDIDVLMRCERFGMRIERLIEPLTVKTMHGANATYATDVMWSGLLGVVRRSTRPSPLLSVLVPMHDAGRYVAEAIESIRAQGRSDMEILVVDDGSEDDGPAIVRALAAHDPSIRLCSANPGREREALGISGSSSHGVVSSRCSTQTTFGMLESWRRNWPDWRSTTASTWSLARPRSSSVPTSPQPSSSVFILDPRWWRTSVRPCWPADRRWPGSASSRSAGWSRSGRSGT
jgi:glycosyltransferase involved in cell wall biosynthesis